MKAQTTGHDFPVIQWNQKDGLQEVSVTSAVADKDKVIWVSTVDGIYRHDGHELTNINTFNDHPRLDDPFYVNQLFIDSKNLMWIATFNTGLWLYDIENNQFKQINTTLKNKLPISNMRLYGLHEINSNKIRFTSHVEGLVDYYVNKDSLNRLEVFTDKEALNKEDGHQLMLRPVIGKSQDLYYSCLTALVRYNPIRDTFVYLCPDSIQKIGIRSAIHDNDLIWCSTYSQGLFSFNKKTKSWKNYRCTEGPDNFENCLNSSSINELNDSLLLLGTYDGMYTFNKFNKSFKRFYDVTPRAPWSGYTNSISWINNELWISSASSSLYKFINVPPANDVIYTGNNINSVIEDTQNERLISTGYNDYFTIHTKDSFQKIYIPNEPKLELEALTIDADKNIWLLSANRLFIYNEKLKSFRELFKELFASPEFKGVHFRKIITHSDGSIWIASHEGTIINIDTKSLDYTLFGNQNKESIDLAYNYRANIEEITDDGKIWFSSQDGFFSISSDKKIRTFATQLRDDNNLPLNMYTPSIAVTQENSVVFGSSLDAIYITPPNRISNTQVRKIKIKGTIPKLSIRDIEIDNLGNIWASTKSGLIKIDTTNHSYFMFSDEHRLSGIDEIIKIEDNKLLINYQEKNGFTIVDTKKLQPYIFKYNIQISKLNIYKKNQKITTDYSLKNGAAVKVIPSDLYIQVHFNNHVYDSKYEKEYAYKIDGINEDWISIGAANEISLSNLKGGIHTLKIKSKLKFHKEYSDPINLLVLDILPPLIQRKWFKFLIATLLLGIIFLVYKLRMKNMQDKQALIIAFNKRIAETEMKALRAQMNPHFLFNVLNAIKLNVQKNEQEKAISFITDFSKLIRSVLHNSEKRLIGLDEELEALDLYLKIENKRFSSPYNYNINIDSNIEVSSVKIPPLLLQPYVENAIWHGILHKEKGKGQINISVSMKNGNHIIIIEDNGIGRKKAKSLKLKSAHKRKSMGMQITKDRMAMNNEISNHELSVTIKDLYDTYNIAVGTRVKIIIKS